MFTEQGQLFALGSFRGSARLGTLTINSPDQYDAFLTEIIPGITPSFEPDNAIDVLIYPNPVTHTLYLSLPEGRLVNIYLFDASGQLLRSRRSSQFSEAIDFSTLPTGTYWVEVQQGKRKKTYRVIKQG